MSRTILPPLQAAHARMKTLRKRLLDFEYVCSGSLHRRWMSCGRHYCGCKNDEDQRHGPYYYWSHLQQGKLMTQLLSQDQAKIAKQAIKNYKAIKAILRVWEQETIKVLRALKDAARR